MKKFLTIIMLLPIFAKAQSYEILADSALHTIWKGKDSVSAAVCYPVAYELYKQAFKRYPGKVEKLALYKAGFLAAALGHKQEAFSFLNRAVDQESWTMVLGKYASDEFRAIINDPQWKLLENKARMVRDQFMKALMVKQHQLESQAMRNKLELKNVSAEEAYRMIRTYDRFPLLPGDFLSLSFKINDSVQSPFLVCLPKQYDPLKSYPLLFSLHGGVLNTTGFPEYMDSTDTGGWNRFYTKYA